MIYFMLSIDLIIVAFNIPCKNSVILKEFFFQQTLCTCITIINISEVEISQETLQNIHDTIAVSII